jgi:protein-S-isoprenylcysteine O-methyltransferase Ste14
MWHWLFIAPWLVFGAWWLVRSLGTARTETRESHVSRLTHAIFLGGGGILLAVPVATLQHRLWHSSPALAYVGLGLELLGIGFAIWAREHLGKLWSGTVTLKEGHHIVQSGPYRLARHPIYTGLLTAVIGVALARGDLAAVLAVVLFAIGIARKIAIEEKLLGGRFGDEYAAYRRKVRAIIPFIL